MPDQTNAEVSDERLRTFAKSLSSGEWTGALVAAYNPTGDNNLTYDQAKAMLVSDLTRRSVTSQASEGEPENLHIIFDGPPSHESGRFVEVENDAGASVRAGEWVERPDGLWDLVIPRASPSKRVERLETLLLQQVKRDYASALETIIKLQGGDAATVTQWQSWTPQAHTLAWIDRVLVATVDAPDQEI